MSVLPRIPAIAVASDAEKDVPGAPGSSEDFPAAALMDLLRAITPEDVAQASRRLLGEWLDASDAELCWRPETAPPATTVPVSNLRRLGASSLESGEQVVELTAATPQRKASVVVAAPLQAQGKVVAALACELLADKWSEPTRRARFERVLHFMELRLHEMGALEDLRLSVANLEQAERLQRALFAIADQASADREMPEVFRALHEIVGSLMYAENFYIVLYDPVRECLRFPYFVDIADTEPPEPERDFSMQERERSITWYLLKRGVPMRGTLDEIEAQIGGQLADFGPDCVDWLGVPLLRGGKAVGGIVVQSYTESARYTERDQALLIYVAQHIQTTLERRFVHEELERRVSERTDALRDANRLLQQQVLERQRGERLQAALFRIAELANSTVGSPGTELEFAL